MPVPYVWQPKAERLQRDIEEEQEVADIYGWTPPEPWDFLRGIGGIFEPIAQWGKFAASRLTWPWWREEKMYAPPPAWETGRVPMPFFGDVFQPEEYGKQLYEQWQAPQWKTGRYYPEWMGGEEVTLGAKGAVELAAELPVYMTVPIARAKPKLPFPKAGKEVEYLAKPEAVLGGPTWRPTGTIPNITPQTTKEMLAKQINAEAYTAIEASALDRASTAFLKTNSLDDFVREMPEFKALSIKEAQELGIALRTTKAGKLRPAIRRSGFDVKEDFAQYPNFKEVGQVSGTWMDATRMMQAIDGGYFGGPLQKYVLWPTQRTTLASLRFSDGHKYAYRAIIDKWGMSGNPALRRIAGDVIEHISKKSVDAPIGAILKRRNVIRLIGRFPRPVQERIVRYAQDTRKYFDDLIDAQNVVRTKRAQDVIPYRDNYRPWVLESNIWSRFFGLRRKPADIMKSPEMPDYIKPTKPFNPREMARAGGLRGYEKERDLQKLVYDYIDTASKDIFNTNVVHNAKIHATQLRSMGFENSATLIEDWAAEAYAGVTPRLARGIRTVVPMKVIRPALWLRRRLTAAVFPLNWTWNMFVQTSSSALTVMRYGVRNTLSGLDWVFSSQVRKEVSEQAYSHIIKKRMAGSVAYQDIGAGIEKTLKLEASVLETVEHYANFLTTKLENILTSVSIRAAYHDGLKRGFKRGSRELWQYASEGGSKTQSMYNLQDLPGVLRAKEVGALAPFQTFAFEVFNSVRELNIIGVRSLFGRAGAYETTTATSALGKATIQRRTKMLLEWFATLTAVNMVVDRAINRKPWSTSSFIPFFAVLTGGVNAGNPWNQPLPFRYSQEVYNGIKDVVQSGNWRRLRSWAIKYHMIGGVQLDRTLKGIEAVIEGGYYDVRDRRLFEVNPDEAWKVIFMGIYASEGGKEYIDKMQESRGIGFEYTGIPMPKLPESGQLKKATP